MDKTEKAAIIANGWNSLINLSRESIVDQFTVVTAAAKLIVDMIDSGWKVAIGHWNVRQGGFVFHSLVVARRVEQLHKVLLVVCRLRRLPQGINL